MKNIKILALLICTSVFSQMKYGVKGGLNLADISQGVNFKGSVLTENVTINDGGGQSSSDVSTQSFNQTVYINTSPKISFYLGGFLETPINTKKNLFLRTELLYCQNGATLDKKTEDLNQDIYYSSSGGYFTLGQLNIPILVKFTTNKKISFIGGCYTGVILTAKGTGNDGTSVDLKSNLKNFDFGLQLGTSYSINKNLSIELCYNRGIINLDKTSQNFYTIEVSGLYYNRTVHLGLEYQF
ncbi:MAG: porin family protein [Limnohabitans sp.]|nr:porin family protein [Limnohabitans sp.]